MTAHEPGVRALGGTEVKRLNREWRRRTVGRIALVLDGLQGPFNVGGIIRTAAAERVERIWYAAGAVTPDNPKVGKTAMGTDRYLLNTVVDRTAEAIAEARSEGFRIVGLELAGGSRALHELDLGDDICLVIGHEDRGLGRDALAACDDVGYVPQLGKVGSLNVAAAAAIAVYEVRRNHWTR